MLATARERLKAIKESGKTVAEAIEAQPLADLEAKWGKGLFRGDRWIELVYLGAY